MFVFRLYAGRSVERTREESGGPSINVVSSLKGKASSSVALRRLSGKVCVLLLSQDKTETQEVLVSATSCWYEGRDPSLAHIYHAL